MGYGNTFEEVASRKKHPEKIETEYGWRVEVINEPEFSLKQFFLKKGFNGKSEINGGVIFLEKGKLTIKKENDTIVLEKGKSVRIPEDFSYNISADEECLLYVFSGSSEAKLDLEPKETFGILDKYWGKIESIESNDNFAAKRIFMNKDGQSSLEYHCHKKEGYIIQSGKLKVGTRVGRAENKSIILEEGDVFVIPLGVMHMRIGMEDTIIIEISTKDDDADSHLVEDGQTYVHKEE